MDMNTQHTATKFAPTKLSDRALLVKLTIRRAALTRRDDQINELERLCAGYVFGIETIKESPSARETARDRLKAIADKMSMFGG